MRRENRRFYLVSTLPYIPPELVEYLEKLYPDASPRLDTPDRSIWWKAGEVSVVRHLRSVLEEQQETVL